MSKACPMTSLTSSGNARRSSLDEPTQKSGLRFIATLCQFWQTSARGFRFRPAVRRREFTAFPCRVKTAAGPAIRNALPREPRKIRCFFGDSQHSWEPLRVWHSVCLGLHRDMDRFAIFPSGSSHDVRRSETTIGRRMVSGKFLPRTKYQMDVGAGRDDRLWVIADAGDEAMGSLGSVLESADGDWLLGRGVWVRRTVLSAAGIT